MRDWLRGFVLCLVFVLLPSRASALVHVVQAGDTLAAIAERYYGKIQHERLLVAANRLDVQGGIPLVVGMRLEVPTTSHYVVKKGDTWAALSLRFLGNSQRSDVLSMSNGSSPWMTPEAGARIMIPYNLALSIASDETVVSIAQKYLGDRNKAWMLTRYNDLKKGNIERGAVLLVPVTDIELSEEGQRLATEYKAMEPDTASSEQRREQKRVALRDLRVHRAGDEDGDDEGAGDIKRAVRRGERGRNRHRHFAAHR